MIPLGDKHLLDLINRRHTFSDGTHLIDCIYCRGYGKQPTQVYYQWGYESRQMIGAYSTELCSVCQGKARLHVYPPEGDDPWLRCQICWAFGYDLEPESNPPDTKHFYFTVVGLCRLCHGIGFTFFSGKSPIVKKNEPEHKPYTGETRRLYEDEVGE